MSERMIRLSGIAYESLVNGPGLRRVFFSQGCIHNCDECFNPSTHSFDGGELKDIDKLVEDIKYNPMIKGVTFSGGDPFEQADEFAHMANKLKKLNLNIWCYTGYTFEYILEHANDTSGWLNLIENVDVLVDGKFEKSKIDSNLKFRGSSNQRIIDVKESFNLNSIVILDF